MTQFPDERGTELRELFFETAQELLQSLNDETLKLEKKKGNNETVRSIRRIVHTLKGDAAACGFHELSELAHALEDALALETAAAHASLPEIVFRAADTFAAMLVSYRSQAKLPPVVSLRKTIRDLAQAPEPGKSRSKKSRIPSSVPATWSEYEELAMKAAVKQGKKLYHIKARIDTQCLMPIAARQLILNALSEVGQVLGTRPESGSTEITSTVQLLLASTRTTEELTAKCRIPTVVSQAKVESIEISDENNGAAKTRPTAHDARASESELQVALAPELEPASSAHDEESSVNTAPAAGENILRVEAERIDAVLNLVGELIIGKSMLQQTLNEFSQHYPKDSIRGRFADAMAFQARVLNDLQRSVMKVRMVPVEQLFRRFPRMVRDIAKQCGRDVRLVLNGQETDLDKSLLDAIAEPLTHLVRNAIGHGIESAEDRIRNGKPAQGTILLNACHQGNQVIVEVCDDGRGINAHKVRARAIERSFLRAEETSLSEVEILQFIFRPGFSTADEITELSGRGVGLDVVQSVLQRLKGSVQVETRPAQGTTFRLKLPLTLAIIKALLFRVEQRLYAIPLNAVSEIARARESDLHLVDRCEILQLRNHALPVLRLGSPPAEEAAKRGKIFVLVITMVERKFGLLVNALEGEEELVIKALDDQTVETDLVSGASILGDGRVVLILNLAAMADYFAKAKHSHSTGPAFGLLLSHTERARIAPSTPGGRP